MIGLGTSPGKTYSADVQEDAVQAPSCFVGVILTPYHMDYHKWLYRSRRLAAEMEAKFMNNQDKTEALDFGSFNWNSLRAFLDELDDDMRPALVAYGDGMLQTRYNCRDLTGIAARMQGFVRGGASVCSARLFHLSRKKGYRVPHPAL